MDKYIIFMDALDKLDTDALVELFNEVISENDVDAFACFNMDFEDRCKEKFYNDFRWLIVCVNGDSFDVDAPFIIFDGCYESRFMSFYDECDFCDDMKFYLWRIAYDSSDVYDRIINEINE